MILKRIAAGIIAATIAATGVVTMSAATATSASAATTVQTSTSTATVAPLLKHRRCIWIGKKGKIRFGHKVRSATIKWRNGHWVIKRTWGCKKSWKWRW